MYWLDANRQTKKIIFHGDFRQFFLTIELTLADDTEQSIFIFWSGPNREPGV
jgi:hypothetical protein